MVTVPDLDDSIPALDELPEAQPASERERINTDVPIQPKKPSIAIWLADLRETLQACDSHDELETVLNGPDVRKAQAALQGTARRQLQEIVAEALARHGERV